MSAFITPRQPTSILATQQQPSLFDHNVDASTGWTPSKRSRSRGSSGASMDPSEEWARLFQAAERRKVQNRNAQRKYRRSLKQRLESLEEQGAHVGSRSTSASSTSSDTSSSSRPHANSASSTSSVASLATFSQDKVETQMDTSKSQHLGQTNWMAQTPDLWSALGTPNGMMLPHAQTDDMFGTSMPQLDTAMEHMQPSVEMPDQTSLSSYFDQYPESNMNMGLAISEIPGMNPTHSMCQADMSQLRAVSASIPCTTNVCDNDLRCPAPPSTPYNSPSLKNACSRSPTGVNPLHLAAMRGFDPIIKLLLEQGADVNEVDANGCTALHLAVENGHQSAVQVLLENGADFTVKAR